MLAFTLKVEAVSSSEDIEKTNILTGVKDKDFSNLENNSR